uniref:Uncharacterized protein n=1 Tax=Tanacetum cinerariifolium TaxID=118510 RepID=A0A6L2JI65_TANCI|nr:hypothetical protein [Tanacetum cinerariifolium]
MTFEEIKAKFNMVWKHVEDFIPMGSKEEAKRHKRKGIRSDQESLKKLKSSEEVIKDVKSTKEIPEEKIKEMMQLVHTEGQRSYWKIIKLGGSLACYQFFIDLLKQLDREDLNQLWALVKEYLSIRPATNPDLSFQQNADVQRRQSESQAQIYQIDLKHADKVLSMQDDELEAIELKEVVEVVTTTILMTEVLTAASATIIAATSITVATITAAPSATRRRKGVVIRDPEETTTPSIIINFEPKSKDKGKEIMFEEPKPQKKQAQIEQDEACTRELEAKLNKNINWDDVIDQMQRKEKEDNAVMREDLEVLWQLVKERFASLKPKSFSDDFLLTTLAYERRIDIIDADDETTLVNDADNEMFNVDDLGGEELAKRLQVQEQAEFSDVEKATLFQQLLEKGRKHFVAKRVEEKRNKPTTQAQKRKIICTYLKNIKGYKLKDEEVAIDAISLAVKSPRIVNWKIYKEGKKSYYQIIRADGKSQMYMFFSQMLKCFDREDLKNLYKLVKARYASTRPVKNMDYLLWSDMKLMFKPHVEDEGRIVRIKSLLDAVGITATQVCVNAAQLELVMLVSFNEKYIKCILLLVEVKTTSTKLMLPRKLILQHLETFGGNTRDLDSIWEENRHAFGSAVKFKDVGIKSLLDAVRITVAQVCVNAAQLEFVLLVNFNEKYTKCLLLLVEVKTANTKLMLLRKL